MAPRHRATRVEATTPAQPRRRVLARTLAAVSSVTALAGCQGGQAAQSPGGSSATITAASPSAAPLVLSDDGVGKLRLGMSTPEAEATGLLGAKREDLAGDEGPEACAAFAGKQGVDLVYVSGGRVVIIAVTPQIRTASGVGVGDTYRDLHSQYPDARPAGPGRLEVPAVEAPVEASYRFATDAEDTAYPDSKITEIALQADDQTCYE